MGSGSPYFWAGKSTAFNWFGSIPFGMNAQSINSWFYEGNGQALMNELYDRFDLVIALDFLEHFEDDIAVLKKLC